MKLNLHNPETRKKALIGAGAGAALLAFNYARHHQPSTSSTGTTPTDPTIDPVTGIPYALEAGLRNATVPDNSGNPGRSGGGGGGGGHHGGGGGHHGGGGGGGHHGGGGGGGHHGGGHGGGHHGGGHGGGHHGGHHGGGHRKKAGPPKRPIGDQPPPHHRPKNPHNPDSHEHQKHTKPKRARSEARR